MKYPDHFPAFVHRVQARLRRGAEEYGDKTFSRDPIEIVEELQQEVEDVCGWGYCLWLRLENIKKHLPVVLLALFLGGCSWLGSDWVNRPKGMHQEHRPQFWVHTFPRWEGPPGEVTVFARVNHSDWQGAELVLECDGEAHKLPTERDLSWVWRTKLPKGHHEFGLWVLLDGETKAYRRLTLILREEQRKVRRRT